MPRKLYNFYIDPELAAGLKQVKARDGVPEGETIRRALAAYLKTKRVVLKGDRRSGGGVRTRLAGTKKER